MLIIKVLSGIAFFGSIAWFIALPGYEPAIAIVTSLSAFIAAWLAKNKRKKQAIQRQSVSGGGVGIQAGGDASIGSIQTNEESKRDAE